MTSLSLLPFSLDQWRIAKQTTPQTQVLAAVTSQAIISLKTIPKMQVSVHLRKPSVQFSLTLISPLAEFTATEMPSFGLCDLPFFTDRTLTTFGVNVYISPRENSAPHEN